VYYHGANTAEAGVHTVRLPKESAAADVCEALRAQLPASGRPTRLRLLEVFYSKIYKARRRAYCNRRADVCMLKNLLLTLRVTRPPPIGRRDEAARRPAGVPAPIDAWTS